MVFLICQELNAQAPSETKKDCYRTVEMLAKCSPRTKCTKAQIYFRVRIRLTYFQLTVGPCQLKLVEIKLPTNLNSNLFPLKSFLSHLLLGNLNPHFPALFFSFLGISS